jgi:hypothetical protein
MNIEAGRTVTQWYMEEQQSKREHTWLTASYLLILVGHKVHTEGELVHVCLLVTKIVNSDLGIRDTAVEARLGVRLVLAVPVAPGWSTTHDECIGLL